VCVGLIIFVNLVKVNMVTLKRKGHQGFFEKYKLFEYNNRGNDIYLSIYL